MVKLRNPVVLMVVVLWMLSGCARLVPREEQAPRWVTEGSGSFLTYQDKFFHAVGTARGVQNRMLLRATADNAARDALLPVLQAFGERLIRDAGTEFLSSEEISQHAGTLARLNLRQALISDHWQEPAGPGGGGRLFALCRLDLSVYKENLTRYRALDADLRRAMLDRADEVYRSMTAAP